MLSVCSQEVLSIPALPLDSDVIFLSDFDGVDYATTAVDRSSKAAHISFFGNAHLDAVIKKFGSASYSAGIGGTSGIRLPVDPDYAALIIGDFTIETEIYAPTSLDTTVVAGVFAADVNSDQRLWAFHLTSTSLRFTVYSPPSAADNYAEAEHGMIGGQFYHIAVCRCGPTIRIFVDGVMISSAQFPVRSFSPNPTSIGLSIGCDWDLTGGFALATGNIDAMRITKKAWYRTDASFTPPTNTYGTIGPGLFVDTDTFYAARSSPYSLVPGLFVDTDTFHQPRVSPQTVAPGLVVDSDTVFSPKINTATAWDTTYAIGTLSNGNRTITNNHGTGTGGGCTDVNHGRTGGLVYWEFTVQSVGGANYGIGIVVTGFVLSQLCATGDGGIILFKDGHIKHMGTDLGALMPAMVSGEVYGVAAHISRQLIWFKKVSGTPGNWNGDPTADPAAIVGGLDASGGTFVLPACTLGGTGGSGSDVIVGNFGQAAMVGALPTPYERGFVGGF